MGKKINKKYSNLSMPVKTLLGLFLSSATGIAITFIISLFFSYIFSKSPEISRYIGIYFIISVLSGAFLNGFLGNKLLNFNGLLSGVTSSILFIIVVLSVMLIASDGKLSIYSIFLFIFTIIISAVGGITSANMKRRK